MTAPGTIVVAVGGNALAPEGRAATIATQFEHTRQSLSAVVQLAARGWRIAIVHGNGPQVGDELDRNDLARDTVPVLPLGVLVAATAGWIGYMIQQSLLNALARAGVQREVVTLITQTIVDRDDPGLTVPVKPVGHPLGEQRRGELAARGLALGRDGRGRWRRLAPSPAPIGVVECHAVRRLVEEGRIVIAGGGGGPPVYRHGDLGWEGVEAVVDKDATAAVLAASIRADVLLILTDVDGVYTGWNTPGSKRLDRLNATGARHLLEAGELGQGSMAPKVAAALTFLKHGGARAVIAALPDGERALTGETGTTITGD